MANGELLEPPQDLFFHEPLNAAEYGREHGLTTDSSYDPLALVRDLVDTLVAEPTDSDGLIPWAHGPDSLITSEEIIEKWEIPATVQGFLEDVCRRQIETDLKDITADFIDWNTTYTKRQKLELPALRTDNDMDYRAYKRIVKSAREARLLDHHLPLEPVNTELDEGLEFPAHAYQVGDDIEKAVAEASCEAGSSALQYLTKNLKSDWTDANERELLEYEVGYHGITPKEPLTPPISPQLQPIEYFIPDNQVCTVPIPSDPSSQLSEDLRAVEDKLFGGANDTWLSDVQLLDILEQSEVSATNAPVSPRHKISDLKVEVPLMLEEEDSETLPPPVDFQCFQDSIDLVFTGLDDRSDTTMFDDDFEQTLQAIAATTMMSIEQEKLQVVDAIARVSVPPMDFSIPGPDWDECRQNQAAMLQWIRFHHWDDFEAPRWPVNRVSESKMVWVPWSRPVSKRLSVETIEAGVGVLEALLARTADTGVPNSSNFVWKQPGLAVLQDDDDDDDYDDEDVESVSTKPSLAKEDLMTAIRRKRLLDSQACQGGTSAKPLTTEAAYNNCDAGASPALLIGDEHGGAARLLENYMELHAPKRLKLKHSPFFKSTTENPIRPTKTPSEAAPRIGTPRIVPEMPCPQIKLPDTPLRLIASVSVPRGVLRRLDSLLPGAQLIDRDYNAHNSSIWLPGSVCRSEITSALADEADLIVSPSTGILLTTIIKLRQKPLPGTKGNSAIYSRIEKVSVRYERLIILVSEGITNEMETVDMTPAAAEAFAIFLGFVASLETQGLVFYIAGGEDNLAKWAACMTCRYAADAVTQQYLLQRESGWELFLRRAGVNAYAAQVILGMLKEPYIVIGGQPFCGLAAFIKLSDVERLTRFGDVLGGNRVLQRVSRVIDRNWDQNPRVVGTAGGVPKEFWG